MHSHLSVPRRCPTCDEFLSKEERAQDLYMHEACEPEYALVERYNFVEWLYELKQEKDPDTIRNRAQLQGLRQQLWLLAMQLQAAARARGACVLCGTKHDPKWDCETVQRMIEIDDGMLRNAI